MGLNQLKQRLLKLLDIEKIYSTDIIILNMNETINLVDIGLLILGFTNMIVLIKLEKRSKKI